MAVSESATVHCAGRTETSRPTTVPALRAALAAEWIKLRSIPSTPLYVAAAVALGAGWAGAGTHLNREGILAAAAVRGEDMVLSSMTWLGVTRFTIVVAIVLGAALLTSERESGTAVLTRLAVPRRGMVYGAKVLWAGALGLVVGALAGLGVPLLVRLVLGPAATGWTLAPTLLSGYGLRVALVTALCAIAGVALAALTRSLLATAVIAFAWVWCENLLASMLGAVGDMPAVTPWRNLSYFIDGTGFGMPYPWAPVWGFVPLAVLTLALVLAGAVRHRTDALATQE